MYQLSRNLGALTSCNPVGLFRSVMGQLLAILDPRFLFNVPFSHSIPNHKLHKFSHWLPFSCLRQGVPQLRSHFKYLHRQLFHITLWLICSYITWLPSCILYVQSTLRDLSASLALQIGPCRSCIWICGPQLDNCVLISSPYLPFSPACCLKRNKFYFWLCIARYLISLPPVFLSLCSLFFPLLFVRRLRPSRTAMANWSFALSPSCYFSTRLRGFWGVNPPKEFRRHFILWPYPSCSKFWDINLCVSVLRGLFSYKFMF